MVNEQTLLESLNEQQKEAVLINEGSLLVFAGAGSGKTRVITTKIAYAIQCLGIKPWQILAVTFTNKACREMQERVEALVGTDNAKSVNIRTFHSFGVQMLRRYSEKANLDPNFKIYDDKDSAVLLQQCFPDANKKDLDQAARKIATLKDKMQRPNPMDDRLCRYYNAYQQKLIATGNVDFADMILKTLELLRKDAEVKAYVHNRYKVILVDEYQDSNTAQFLLLKEIAGPDAFVCVVGDDDQSIYRFRGAEVRNILDFPNVFPNTRKVVLGKNYRCTDAILAVAKDIIGNNRTRAQKDLVAAKQGGMKPRLYYVNSEFDEAQQVLNILRSAARNDSRAYEKSAIIYRTNAQSKCFEDRFITNGIPYHIVGSLRFYDREEIRDCIAMISLLANPRDSVAFQRMINKPSRKIGDTSVEKITSLADSDLYLASNVIEAARACLTNGLVKGPAIAGIESFLNAYDECSKLVGDVLNDDLLKQILVKFGILDYYTKRDNDEHNTDNKRTDNLNQLVNMLGSEQFCSGQDGINNFLEFASLDPSSLSSDEGNAQGGVTLITMHNTKGLEYDRVFIVGMEDEIFPGRHDETTAEDIEEERRICYVAVTRARNELYMFSASSRLVWGQKRAENPSQFLLEIDRNHIEEVDMRSSSQRLGDFPYRFDPETSYGYKSSWSNAKYSSNYLDTSAKKGSAYDDDDSCSFRRRPGNEVNKYNLKTNATIIKKGSGEAVKTSSFKSSPAKSNEEKVQTFNVGDRIKSAMYGVGTVTAKQAFGGREIITVSFDNGKSGKFTTDRASFTKVGK